MAVLAVSIVSADWATRTVDAYNHGMTTTDTLWYHMPFAARFVQQGTILPLHYVDSQSVTVFFPATSELFHALGILFMGNDVLSPLINSGWMAIALLAAWCVGRPFAVAPVTLTGVAALLATPGLVATQPGGAYDDIVGLALLLSCVALLVTSATLGGEKRFAGQAIAALAAGVALGTKFTFIAPVGALTVGIWILARRGRRWTEGAVWILLVALTGGFFYARNLIAVGNPLPALALRLGPLELPSPAVTTPSSTFAHFIFNQRDWRLYFLPGLRLSFGPAWWGLLALAAVGLVVGIIAAPNRMTKMVAWTGLATAVAFAVTPQYLAILGVPTYFVDNVRYVDPALAFGLVLLPVVPAFSESARKWWLLVAYGVILCVTQLDGTIWPINLLGQHFAQPIGGIDSLVGLLLGLVVFGIGLAWISQNRWFFRPPTIALIGGMVFVVICGFTLQQFYLHNRYARPTPIPNFAEMDHISNARIAVGGALTELQYELYGDDLNNFVQYVGQSGPHGGYSPIRTCSQWRSIINTGRYDYVVTSTGFLDDPRKIFTTPFSYTVWTSSDSASTLVRRAVVPFSENGGPTEYLGFSLFRLSGSLNVQGCGSPQLRNVVSTPT
jgi:hypothetical protein